LNFKKKIAEIDDSEYLLIKGMARDACEKIGGVYQELEEGGVRIPVCLIKRTDEGGDFRIIRLQNVQVIDLKSGGSGSI